MRVVIALGGNAITPGRDTLDPDALGERVRAAASAIADIARGHDVVVTHGNGPQVGLLALRAQPEVGGEPGEALDALGAESEGLIGYLLERELASIFPGSEVATLLTQVEVGAEDPAFRHPTKPIGPRLSADDAKALERRTGWRFAEQDDGAFRRVVASPEPLRIRELKAIELCVEAGVLVVCAGGGGIPVVTGRHGLRGAEAVIDKDRTASLLATQLHADALLLLTDVRAVYEGWPARDRPIRQASIESLRKLDLAPGSMGPKVEAAIRFAEQGGDARIGLLDEARHILTGEAGTRVVRDGSATTYWPGHEAHDA